MNIHKTKGGVNFHAKVEHFMRELGFEPFRQFEPKVAHAVGPKELFELWKHVTSARLVIVHYYSGSNGVEFYPQLNGGNSWDGAKVALQLQATLKKHGGATGHSHDGGGANMPHGGAFISRVCQYI